jgi:cellulose synthase/poly-beta-1,6-N-acetylglucosamine synthase-like glycosyltransferase
MKPVIPFVSVLIPTYRRAAETALAVRSVVEGDYPRDRFEVIVIDTSPNDETAVAVGAIAEEFPDRVKLIRKGVAEGPGASRNLGAGQARGEIFACFDSDCIADPHWLTEGVREFADSPRLGIVQGTTLPNPQHQRGLMARFVQVDRANCIYECCNVFYRREAFEEVDGFSPEFNLVVRESRQTNGSALARRLGDLWSFAHHQALLGFDTDLAWRVLKKSWTSAFAERSIVYHAVTPLTLTQWIMEGAYYAYSNPPMLKRHPELRSKMYARIFSSRTSALYALFLASVALGTLVHWALLVGTLPHIVNRCSEPSRFWKGIIRPFRFMVYLPRDTMTFVFSAISSVRHRKILL